jgi:hypothetical protein
MTRYRRELRASMQATRVDTFDEVTWSIDRATPLGVKGGGMSPGGAGELTRQTHDDLTRALARGRITTFDEAEAVFTALHELGHLVGEEPQPMGYGRRGLYHHLVEWTNEGWAQMHWLRATRAMGLSVEVSVTAAELVAAGPYAGFCGRIDDLLEAAGVGRWGRLATAERLNALVDPDEIADELIALVNAARGVPDLVDRADLLQVAIAPHPDIAQVVIDRVRAGRPR